MRMGGGPQQFGVDAESVPALVRSLRDRGVEPEGFHVFAGSQNLDAQLIVEGQRQIVDLVTRLADEIDLAPRYVNIGGGFGIPYTSRDVPLDLQPIGEALHDLVADHVLPRLGPVSLVVELGRYLVGEAGVYVTRVVDRKTSRDTTFLVVDGGLHHQLAASGNFGQAIRRNYPLVVGNRMATEGTETVTVVGCLCTPLDLLGDRVALPSAQIDDLVVIFHAGAYGLTASPTAFLSHPAPTEVLV
jgi:diaminopimelate decarboxylase